jgi:Arc/MetJ-type ribon-helix-helix transcriptional regulator
MDRSDNSGSATVAIPAPLFKRIEERIKGTGFPSVSSYVAYVLREVLADEDEPQAMSPEDDELVKQRLRALGYLE